MTHKDGVYFDNGKVQVNRNLVSTQRRYYPLKNTTARIRRDPLWLALGVVTFIALATTTYGDLLHPQELITLWIIAALSLLAGANISILHIDSIGHPHSFIFGNHKTIRQIYNAMREAYLNIESPAHIGLVNETQEETDQNE